MVFTVGWGFDPPVKSHEGQARVGAPSYIGLSLPGRTVVGNREFIRCIELCDPHQ
jgi:hypothetical protein